MQCRSENQKIWVQVEWKNEKLADELGANLVTERHKIAEAVDMGARSRIFAAPER